MRIPENTFVRTTFKGPTGTDGLDYFIDPNRTSLHLGFSGRSHHSHIFFNDLPNLLNFYRDLGEALDIMQPGLVSPLPEGDASEVDAMKIIYEADRLQRGEK